MSSPCENCDLICEENQACRDLETAGDDLCYLLEALEPREQVVAALSKWRSLRRQEKREREGGDLVSLG